VIAGVERRRGQGRGDPFAPLYPDDEDNDDESKYRRHRADRKKGPKIEPAECADQDVLRGPRKRPHRRVMRIPVVATALWMTPDGKYCK